MQQSYETDGPLVLDVSVRSGRVEVTNGPAGRADLEITGREAGEDLLITFDGRVLLVREPEGMFGFWGPDRPVYVTVAVPPGSEIRLATGGADIDVTGTYAQAALDSASGAVRVDRIDAASRVRTGSGRVEVGEVDADLAVATGSGDVVLAQTHAPVRVKVGSGETAIHSAHGDVALSAGSGGLRIDALHEGELRVRTGSGSVSIGVPASVPVWTDVTALGGIANRLTPRGAPTEGQASVRVRGILGSGRLELADA